MSYFDADILDRHAYLDSAAHRLDPRAKVIATLVFITTVVSYSKYAVSSLAPFILFPLAMAIIGFVPARLLIRRVLIALPFLVLIGIFNPLIDRTPVAEIGGLEITGGWISFVSIMFRGCLCIAAAITLIATTSFPRVTEALGALGVPKPFVTQLMLLYRYLFLLVEESRRMNRARSLRAVTSKTPLAVASSMLSVLLMRTMDRGDAVYMAMKARGFDGEMKTNKRMKWRLADTAFLMLVTTTCIFLRLTPVARMVGGLGLKI